MYYVLSDDNKGCVLVSEFSIYEEAFDLLVLFSSNREIFSFITDSFDDCVDFFLGKRNSLKGVEQNENESNRT